jgi:hypothetical protein
MNQRTHSWIAIRAIALLEDEGSASNLVKLLKPYARRATVGAWLPDQGDIKRGGMAVDNHIFKIEPYTGDQQARFTMQKDALLKALGTSRLATQYLKKDTCLNDAWWNTAYRADPQRPGQHLPNRAMALSTMLKDLLVLGCEEIDKLIPGSAAFLKSMAPESRTTGAAAATYFFMMSHFLADMCMPCHCDARPLSGTKGYLHKEWESYWSEKVGTRFEKGNLLQADPSLPPAQDADRVLQQARDLDAKFCLDFTGAAVPDVQKGQDIWSESMMVCRASFAIASIIAPHGQFDYASKATKLATFDALLKAKPDLLTELDRTVLHDAILNVAIGWKHTWNDLCTAAK